MRDDERKEYREWFARWLRKLMRNRYMSANELSRKSGVSVSNICSYVNANLLPSLYTARKICKALGVSLEVLANGAEEEDIG